MHTTACADLLEALARTRAGMAADAGVGRALWHLERALATHYEAEYPCC